MRRRGRDQGVHEVVGYALMFGIGAVAVTMSLNTLLTAKDASDGLSTYAQLSQVAETVANHAARASTIASVAPGATYSIYLTLPDGPGGHEYTVTLNQHKVWVNSTSLDFVFDRDLPAISAARVDGMPIVGSGSVDSRDGVVAVEYRMDPPNQPVIEIKNV